MYDYLDINKLLYIRQSGFREKHSNYALISITEAIKFHIDTDVFIDLQKAFDTVNHDISYEKLTYYGLEEIVNCSLNNF